MCYIYVLPLSGLLHFVCKNECPKITGFWFLNYCKGKSGPTRRSAGGGGRACYCIRWRRKLKTPLIFPYSRYPFFYHHATFLLISFQVSLFGSLLAASFNFHKLNTLDDEVTRDNAYWWLLRGLMNKRVMIISNYYMLMMNKSCHGNCGIQ